MSPTKRYAKKPTKARQRRRLNAPARLERDQRQAQRAAEARPQALEALGWPEDLVAESAGRLCSQHKLLGKIIGVMFPALCLGLEVLAPLWRHGRDMSPAPRSRWQWTWVWDDSVCQKDGTQVGWGGRWGSGQHQRVAAGIDGLWRLVVVGEGRLSVPVDLAMRRPDPVGPGAPCRAKRRGTRVMLDGRVAALRRRGLEWPAPMVVADRGGSDSKLMQHVGDKDQGTRLVESKQSYIFTLADGQKGNGHDLSQGPGWRWRQSPGETGVYYVRLRATSPTYGQETIIIVDELGQDRFSLLGLEPERSAPQLIRRGRRRSWIACVFRTLKHLLATKSCQAHSEDAYSGHLVWRLMGCFVWFYASRVICKGALTMEAMLFSLKHYWRFVDLAALAFHARS